MNKVFDLNKKIPNEFQGQWRSIEFEVIFRTAEALNAFANWAEQSKYDAYITIKGDGSIRYDFYKNEQAREVVVSYRKGDEHIVREVCENLREKAFVNKSCGTHVHFDMRGFTLTQVKNFGARLAQCVPALRLMLPKSRHNNQYCYGSINGIEAGSRYSFVNMQAYIKHKTIEVRAHSGTINASKILNWIAICDQIMTKNKALKTIDSIPALIKHCEFDKEMADYINRRIERLNKKVEKKPKPKKKEVINTAPQNIHQDIYEDTYYDYVED